MNQNLRIRSKQSEFPKLIFSHLNPIKNGFREKINEENERKTQQRIIIETHKKKQEFPRINFTQLET